ncbi:DUF1360 domain-containing protein [Streptomyces sp. AD55]|uniref:DUF1360 domain-containing protein n=1 Tax=Streptomyces sp. AD55 TaxID=3242895 RepID=UPI003528F3B7
MGGNMIGPLALAVLALVAYRGTQLVVHDTILDPIRDPILAWHEARPESTVRDAIATLISCTYCAGWWVSGVVLALYLTATSQGPGPWTWSTAAIRLLEWAAIAGGQCLLNRWDDTRDRSAA